MHIAEGILSPPVLVGGALVALAGLAQGLRTVKPETVPRVGVISAALFIAALIHVPIGVASAHLTLVGLAGLLLGWAAFPAVFVALLLHAILFQFGGLTTLGVNTAAAALPALVVFLLFRRSLHSRGAWGFVGPFLGGALGVALAGVIVAAALFFSDEAAFTEAAVAVLLAHVPIMIIEGVICAFCVGFLRTVKPEMLPVPKQPRELASAS
jgi:cobalt/nickel transport system permease protein